ncbi:MAG: T9SS type A sorting domain-containing protein [Bacteroidia bacterium]|nr:T9SS type A sorting domain-containing protein [Bacteroidia bacterium]
MNALKSPLKIIALLLVNGLSVQLAAQCNCENSYPAPQGGEAIVYITPAQGVSGIQTAINNATSPTTIFLMNGTYNVSGGQINITKPNITLRSFSGKRDSVIIYGGGMLTGTGYHGISILNTNAKVIDLTIKNIDTHPIDINFWYQPGDIDNLVLHNLHIADGGEQLIKMSYSGNLNQNSHNGIIECCLIEYTTSLPGSAYYTNGIDLHYAENWLIQDNTIRNIQAGPGTTNDAGPAILFFKGGKNMIVERNLIIDCDEGIFLGNWADPAGFASTDSGIVRNNFIRGHANSRCGIGIVRSPNARILNNTIFSPGGTVWTAQKYSIEVTGPEDTNLVIQNNLMDETILNNQGTAPPFSDITNIDSASASNVIQASGINPDLHLTSTSVAIDAGTPHSLRNSDFDCGTVAGNADVGADEIPVTTGVLPGMIDGKKLNLFPNPATEFVTIYGFESDNVKINVTDLFGKTVLSAFEKVKDQKISFDIKTLPGGSYFVEIFDGTTTRKKTLLVQ